MSRVLVIAEAGVNHNGNLDLARELIDTAAEAGADVVKFQTFNADRLVTRSAAKAPYQNQTTSASESQHEMLQRLELTPSMHEQLMAHCRRKGISFLSTPFDIESVHYLAGLGLEVFKVPSGEITNLPYLRSVGACARRVIMSTGMAVLGEIEAAVEALERAGTARDRITVLHCTTEYPTPMGEVNLRAMISIQQSLGVAVGYSDHTPGIEVAIAATALGASIIEKHFTMSRDLPGPDHKASLEPAELSAMVRGIRHIEVALGDGIKRLTQGEVHNRPVARKSIVAAVPIARGQTFSPDNITAKRPGTGLSPMRWDEVVGRTATRDFKADEPIDL